MTIGNEKALQRFLDHEQPVIANLMSLVQENQHQCPLGIKQIL